MKNTILAVFTIASAVGLVSVASAIPFGGKDHPRGGGFAVNELAREGGGSAVSELARGGSGPQSALNLTANGTSQIYTGPSQTLPLPSALSLVGASLVAWGLAEWSRGRKCVGKNKVKAADSNLN